MKTEIYDIEGMHCAACSSAIERVTRKLDGVQSSEVNLPMNRLTILYDETRTGEEQICAKIKKAGFSARLHTESDAPKTTNHADTLRSERAVLLASIALSALLFYISMGQMLFTNLPLPEIFSMHAHPTNFAIIQLVLTLCVLFLEKRFFISGFTSLFHGNPNMDTLVAISASTSFLYSFVMTLTIDTNAHAVHHLYYESAAMVLALVSVGKYLESKNKDKTKGAIAKLMQLAPSTALLVDENGQWEVPLERIHVGDTVLVQAGKSVPLDGKVLHGRASVNESMLTGESLPVEKAADSTVIGGSICVSGAVHVQVTHVGADTTLANIVRFVEDAQGKKAPIAKLADTIAGMFVPIVIGIALLASVIWLLLGREVSFALNIFTCVLVIACPCSLGLATPTSIIVGTGLGASNGILIRNGEALERTHSVDIAIFDKTGTITEGAPRVTDIFCNDGDETAFLSRIIAIEQLSSHPLATAICAQESIRGLHVAPFTGQLETLDGLGLVAHLDANTALAIGNERLMAHVGASLAHVAAETATMHDDGKTVMYVAENGVFIGYIAAVDIVKPSATAAIRALHSLGIHTVMLTGDNEHTARCIARSVGIDDVIAHVLPTEKAAVVQRYQQQAHTVMMIGDGINDAPALAQADIGCAVGTGSDIAIESAHIILMKDDLRDVAKAIQLSHHTMRNIKENLFWAFAYNCLCIPIAAGVLYPHFGILLSPMIGGFAMSMSSLFVVSNALRLRRARL